MKSIALWLGVGGAISSLGPLISAWRLQHFCRGSFFLITLLHAAVALEWCSRSCRAKSKRLGQQ
jgi:MFS transporter, DHA2 family, multidrug resistance protein